ncbi:MAG: AMP-binding protein [Elainellaceae cyanobacterium]
MAIADGLLRVTQTWPDRPAVVVGDRTYSYGDLGQQIQQMAARLQTVERQDRWPDPRLAACTLRVGLLLGNRLETLVTFWSTALIGGVAMVLNPDWSPAQLQATLHRYPPDLLVTDTQGMAVLADHLPPGLLVWDVDTDWELGDETFMPPAIAPDTPFYIGFTSGTTGLPKGILRHHQSWIESFAVSRQEFGIGEGDRVLVPGSLAYSLSLFTAVDSLQAGATLYLLPNFSVRQGLRLLDQAAITWLVGVPTMVGAIARLAERRRGVYPSVRGVICAGGRCPASLAATTAAVFPKAVTYAYYGASELSFVSLRSSQESPPLASVGRAMAGVRLSVLRDNGDRCEPGEVGWIAIQSSMVSLGYLTDEPEGLRWLGDWATVGDRGWLDEQGWLYLAGRQGDRLTTGGLTLYPRQLEQVLEQRLDIRQAAVVGVPDEQRGDRLVAVLAWQGAERPTRRQLLTWMRTQVPRAHCPQQFYTTSRWPIAPSGKLDRSGLRQWILEAAPELEVLR